MPPTRKIRGHHRHWRAIDRWVAENRALDLGSLYDSYRQNAKLRVTPWGWSARAKHEYGIGEPRGETKRRILRGLLAIHASWARTLEDYRESYYLKIWLFEPHFSESQVVCVLGDRMAAYANAFGAPLAEQARPLPSYGVLDGPLGRLSWTHRLEEVYLTDQDPGDPGRYPNRTRYEEECAYVAKMLRRPHRTVPAFDVEGRPCNRYHIPVGHVWVGTKK